MSALEMMDRRLSCVGDAGARNQRGPRGTITTRGDCLALIPNGPHRELLRVLVVDDYHASADTMARLIAAWGHDVRQAYDANIGLALAAAYQPDVLLLDLVMSGVSGLALSRQVRRQAHVNGCLMIAVTGRTDTAHRLQCEEAGIDLFLVKPVDLSFVRTLLAEESEYLLRARQYAESQLFSIRLKQLLTPACC